MTWLRLLRACGKPRPLATGSAFLPVYPCCHYSSQQPPHTRHVWVSTSRDIYANLALEDWMLQHMDFSDQSYLLLWQNAPCVVVGRHQNPWGECRLPLCRHLGVNIARRQSGGGTVYHDLGNMCLTFFTSRDRYHRENNLEFICQSLRQYWGVDVQVGPRDDILLAKKHKAGLQSRATESVRSEVRNLSEENSSLRGLDNVVPALAQDYFLVGGEKGDYCYVDPGNEHQFPGLLALQSHLSSWEWVYGRTPAFNILSPLKETHVNLRVEKGRIVAMELEKYISDEFQAALMQLGSKMVGTRLNSQELLVITQSMLRTTTNLQQPMKKLIDTLGNFVDNT